MPTVVFLPPDGATMSHWIHVQGSTLDMIPGVPFELNDEDAEALLPHRACSCGPDDGCPERPVTYEAPGERPRVDHHMIGNPHLRLAEAGVRRYEFRLKRETNRFGREHVVGGCWEPVFPPAPPAPAAPPAEARIVKVSKVDSPAEPPAKPATP